MFDLKNIFTDSDYKISQFTQEEISALEQKIFLKNNKPFIKCLIRGKDIQLKPEEAVRQLFLQKLINFYGYKTSQIQV